MKVFTVSEPIFKTETLFVLDCSFQAFESHLKRRYRMDVGEYIGQCGQMFTFTGKAPWRCVWASSRQAPIVLHEVFHLVTRICEDKGVMIKAHVEHGESGDETAAYLFEYFVRSLWKRLT
jgi:hypothetical protein